MSQPVKTTRNRFVDAYYAQEGACNPVAIAGDMCQHIQTVLDEGGDPSTDVAISMIIHQLASLHGVHVQHVGEERVINPLTPTSFLIIAQAYHDCLKDCVSFSSTEYDGIMRQFLHEGAKSLISILYEKSKAERYDSAYREYSEDYAIIKEVYNQS